VQPGPYVGSFLEFVKGLPRLDKYFLREILGLFAIPCEAYCGPVNLRQKRQRRGFKFVTPAFGNRIRTGGHLYTVKVLEEKHKLATRWFHWINFPILSAMIFSGLLIGWTWDPYRIGLGSVTLFAVFPTKLYEWLGLDGNLALGMALHFVFAWIFAINGIAYVVYTLVSGEWRALAPDKNSFGDAIKVAMHDAGSKVPLPPQGRYNAAQRLTYSAIIVMGGFSLVTGLAIYKPAQLHWLTAMLGGYEWARWEHFWLTMGYVGFFLIHIAQVIRAGWANFRSMVAGYDLVDSHE
jgi:thiosulfate reductase cytochrome b subunit